MNIKKKILFLVTQSEFGGAQRFIYNLVTALRRYTQIGLRRKVGDTQIHAEKDEFLYPDITYKIRGACYKIWKQFRGAFKEKVIENALEKELSKQGLKVNTQKQISVLYDKEKIGKYVPDMVVDDKIIIELKSKTFLTKEDEKQFWLYLKGSEYRLGLLINFGRKLEIKRKIYDTARDKFQRESAYSSPDFIGARRDQRVSANYEVVVAAGPEGDDENGLLSILEKRGINTKHLKYLRRSINPFFDFLGLIEIYKLMRKEKPDILFLCSSKAGFLGSLAARRYTQIGLRRKVGDTQIDAENYQRKSAYPAGQDQRLSARPKVIYRIGGWTFNDPWPKWKKKLYISIEKYTAKLKDIIVNNADSDRKQAIELGIKPKEKIVLIHNGVDTAKLDSEFLSKEEARRELNLEQSDFIVGTIANFYPPKGLKYLIEATHLLSARDSKFIVIGDGEERSLLEKMIEEKKLKNNFILKGVIPEAYKYLKAFDIFVLPSVKEGFPWTILEAMAAEVPVIATKVGAIPEIIENNKNGILIEPKNPNDLAESIKRLIDDKNLRENLAREARKTVEERFRLDRMVKKIEELIK